MARVNIRFFKKAPAAGQPISVAGFAAGVAAMARALENMEVTNGSVSWFNGRPRITVNHNSGEQMPAGTNKGDILYWDGATSNAAWTVFSAPTGDGMHVLTVTSGVLTWSDVCEPVT